MFTGVNPSFCVRWGDGAEGVGCTGEVGGEVCLKMFSKLWESMLSRLSIDIPLAFLLAPSNCVDTWGVWEGGNGNY